MPQVRKIDNYSLKNQHAQLSTAAQNDELAHAHRSIGMGSHVVLHPEFVLDEMDYKKLSESIPDGSAGDLKKVHQHNTELLLHKLGQRLAFERASVRLYEALIFKCLKSDRRQNKIVSVDLLRQFRDEEVEHSYLLKTAIETLGFDPDVWMPDADSDLLASLQVPKVFSKADTSILQCLEAVQIFATNDNAEWHNLCGLFTNMGLNELAEKFNQALKEDGAQLETISRWIYQLTHA